MHTNFNPFLYSVEAYFHIASSLSQTFPFTAISMPFVFVPPPHWPKYSSIKDDKTPCINILPFISSGG